MLIHRIIDSRKFWEFGPIVFKRVIKETVIGTVGRKTSRVVNVPFFYQVPLKTKVSLGYILWDFIKSQKVTKAFL